MKKYFFKYITLLILLISLSSFNFRDVMTGSWNPQYIYTTNGQIIRDMAFADSLTGFITTWHPYNNDGSLFKTTNGGDNWFTLMSFDTIFLRQIDIINKDSIVICEGNSLLKSSNKGVNWTRIYYPGYPYNEMGAYSMYALNFDTIWIGAGSGFHIPQLYLTTNGGLNWTLKFQASDVEFDNVYFYNKRIGFCCDYSSTYKTTNGGDNWFQLTNDAYTKIYFIDSLTGWKCQGSIQKTTDGGYNWVTQTLPSGGQISSTVMFDFSVINKDTLWGVGGSIYLPPPYLRTKGTIYKTTNGGLNWGYQLPDTNLVKFGQYNLIFFVNKNIGWAYKGETNYPGQGGIHTITGGLDTTYYTNIKEQTTNIASQFILYQNYPNPFNQFTIINVKLKIAKQIRLDVYDITGKLIATIVNKKENTGNHSYKFDGGNLSSGVYFYTLTIDAERIDTKKLMLIK